MKNLKKTFAVTLTVLSICLCMTGCGNDETTVSMVEDSEGNLVPATTPFIVADEIELVPKDELESTTSTTESESSSEEESDEEDKYVRGEEVLVPECPVNTNLALGDMTINNVNVAFTDMKLTDLLSTTATEHNAFSSCNDSIGDYMFTGVMFGVAGEPDPEYSGMTVTIDGVEYDGGSFPTFGTTYAVEVLGTDGVVVYDDEFDINKAGEYTVKAIHSSEFFLEEDFDVLFCNGLKAGMTQDEAFALLGEPFLYEEDDFWGNEYLYNNGTHTLSLLVESDTDDNGNEVFIVDEITLFNNTTAVEQ